MLKTGFVQPGTYGMEDHNGSDVPAPGTVTQIHDNGRWKCSDKQRELILKIVDEHSLDKNEVDHLARWRGGDDSPEAVAAAYEAAFLRLERDEGPVNFDDAAEREKCRLDGLRVVAAYLDSPEAMQEKPRAVEVMLREDIPGLSVPLTGAMDLVEGNFTPVDFKSAVTIPSPPCTTPGANTAPSARPGCRA